MVILFSVQDLIRVRKEVFDSYRRFRKCFVKTMLSFCLGYIFLLPGFQIAKPIATKRNIKGCVGNRNGCFERPHRMFSPPCYIAIFLRNGLICLLFGPGFQILGKMEIGGC